LCVRPIRQVIRQRGDDFNLVVAKKPGGVLLARDKYCCQVAAVNYMAAHLSRRPDEVPEVRVEFRRSASDVQSPDAGVSLQRLDDMFGSLARHFLGAVRPGIHMAVLASLVASLADVDLKRIDAIRMEGEEPGALQSGVEDGQCHCDRNH